MLRDKMLKEFILKDLKLTSIASVITLGLGLTACAKLPQVDNDASKINNLENTAMTHSNPFFQPYDTFQQIPDFKRIKNEHYLPAFKQAITEQQHEIKTITENKNQANFANTIEALEFSGELLNKVSSVFYNLTSANTNDELQLIAKQVSPLLSEANDDILLNHVLFQRIKTVYLNKDELNLTTAQAKLLTDTYQSFVRGGANLTDNNKVKLRKLNSKIAQLSIEFGDNLLAETNTFELIIDKKHDLSGLPQNIIEQAETTAKERGYQDNWVFTTHKPSITPFLTYADNRELRKKLYLGYIERGNNNNANDNKKLVANIAALRAQRAILLGYKTHAHLVLEDRTAKTPDNVYQLIDKIWPIALAQAKSEAQAMQALVNKNTQAKIFTIKPWDWEYYSDKIRIQKYDFNEQDTRPYFSLNNTIDGVFYTANKLFGITVKERTDLPKYHQDVRTWEVYDKNNKLIAIFMGDYFVRESKRGGAWMNAFRSQQSINGNDTIPIIVNVLNYTPATAGEPTLLTFDEASTLFHEFGHALHGMLSQVNYRSQSGTSVARDFVEFPSQVMENWMTEPEVLSYFAKHYQTDEVIPQALVDKIQAASQFNQGFATVEYIAAAKLDLDWHTLTDKIPRDTDIFEAQSIKNMGLIEQITPRYRSTYFAHIFSGGYSAGYYSYIWSEILAADAFAAFKESSIFDLATANAYKKYILSQGGSDDPMLLYKKFRGKEASIEALLKSRGLLKR